GFKHEASVRSVSSVCAQHIERLGPVELHCLFEREIGLSSEPDVDGREAELRATEDGRDLLRIVGHVRPDRMHVAPRALDRVVAEDAAAAARLEQAIDGPHAPVDRLYGIPPIAGTPGQRNCFAVTSAAWGVPGGAVSENGRLRQGPPATRAVIAAAAG